VGPNSRQILQAAGGKIINNRNRMAACQKSLNQMRPDEARPAGHEDI
jgi:hypothetical protein